MICEYSRMLSNVGCFCVELFNIPRALSGKISWMEDPRGRIIGGRLMEVTESR